jgi:hypothetical protein
MTRNLIIIGILAAIFIGGFYMASQGLFGDNGPTRTEDLTPKALTEGSRARVEKYIREHVSEFSPEKEVLGGKFYVTKVEFLSSSRTLVEYEDGHNGFTANVDFYTDTEGIVRIVDWRITKKN